MDPRSFDPWETRKGGDKDQFRSVNVPSTDVNQLTTENLLMFEQSHAPKPMMATAQMSAVSTEPDKWV